MILLDSSDIIAFPRGLPSALSVLTRADQSRDELTTLVICVAEVLAGMRRGEEARTYALPGRMQWSPMKGEIAQFAGELKLSWSCRGRTLQLSGCLIAATSILEDCELATLNRKDLPMPEIWFHEDP